MSLLRNKRAVVVTALLVLLLWPASYLASPRWEVLVISTEGQPLSGANVRLAYVNYSVESNSHEMTLQTDESGRVLFPEVHRRANLAQWVLFTASSATAGVHASFGRHASVFAFGNYEGSVVENGYIFDWQGSPNSLQSKIVAK